ncbi:hypothetical protein Sipo8835_26160 [Streptomyces ipomoeae]|uniref:DUF8083 domain-containing protein n=2 Tax=Streptomyces ipomoeae TaxID=103232 RepID=L1KZC8_9ACTN|nr:hypothetical protein [Streptomyces ipomoeae]EKX65894.1 hypothetical protein STRIP9103_04519 [Streptomyces ipomoeae 91-03]MDX2696569.1 hypothetical protein [Streptomyces ipomoeae]MDX2842703.1 hypothetical protein [Streptomyces ipomoeae]TQE28304.1 hypothetical protein Sipo8835_26160 [Streptomyces ipomoeae]TQE30496.1 hypothetical protein Sipo7851_27235 [Streptomyces ipomoeae]
MPKVSSVIVPYASYLRVYEPLAAFPEPERSHWARYARRTDRPSYQDELRRSLADLVPIPPIPVPVHESSDAFVLEVDGTVCVCPWRTRLRGWQALGDLAEELPAPVLDAVLPPLVRRQASQDYERWMARNPDARPWIRTSTWHVPLNWFVLVSDEERTYEKGTGETSPVLRYRTPMVQARRRVARGLRALRETLDEGPLIDGLIDVGRWLEEFHPRSLVELDYGGLVHVLPATELDGDHSAADVAEGIEALRTGDGLAAGEAYGRLVERWRAVRDRRSAN